MMMISISSSFLRVKEIVGFDDSCMNSSLKLKAYGAAEGVYIILCVVTSIFCSFWLLQENKIKAFVCLKELKFKHL